MVANVFVTVAESFSLAFK